MQFPYKTERACLNGRPVLGGAPEEPPKPDGRRGRRPTLAEAGISKTLSAHVPPVPCGYSGERLAPDRRNNPEALARRGGGPRRHRFPSSKTQSADNS